MLQPKKTKFRKSCKGRLKNIERKSKLRYGSYGLKALEPVKLTASQLEAGRRAIAFRIKKLGKLWVRPFPDLPVTKKPSEVRIGKGKGNVNHWVCRVLPGTFLYEIESNFFSNGISPKLRAEKARAALRAASIKMSCQTVIVSR